MPAVNIIGRLVGASEFEEDALFCKFEIKSGKQWNLLEVTFMLELEKAEF